MRPAGVESTLSHAILLSIILQAGVAAMPGGAASPEPAPPVTAPAQSPAILSVPPPFAAPTPPEPRRIDDLSRPLTGFVPQGSYEAGVRGAVARAQNLLGPLDGAWLVTDPAGAILFRFQLVDPGFSGGPLEGVWSDQGASGPDARGFFSGISRMGTTVTLQFARPGAGASTLTLQPRPEGGYAGELASVAARTQVVMIRPPSP